MYNSTSKSIRKNLNIINQNRDSCKATARIKVNDEDFVVERTSEKYIKRLKGVETQEASTDLEFYKEDMLLETPQDLMEHLGKIPTQTLENTSGRYRTF